MKPKPESTAQRIQRTCDLEDSIQRCLAETFRRLPVGALGGCQSDVELLHANQRGQPYAHPTHR